MTTIHIIPETGYEVCFVPIPEETSGYKIETSTLIFDIKHGLDKVFEPLPNIGFALLSTLSEITEEKLEGVMPLMPWGNKCYKNYCLPDGINVQMVGKSAIESLKSLMQYLKLYIENPYGKKPLDGAYDEELKWAIDNFKWTEAQSRTFADYAILVRTVNK